MFFVDGHEPAVPVLDVKIVGRLRERGLQHSALEFQILRRQHYETADDGGRAVHRRHGQTHCRQGMNLRQGGQHRHQHHEQTSYRRAEHDDVQKRRRSLPHEEIDAQAHARDGNDRDHAVGGRNTAERSPENSRQGCSDGCRQRPAEHAGERERGEAQVHMDAGAEFDGQQDRADRRNAGHQSEQDFLMSDKPPPQPDRQMRPDRNRQAYKCKVANKLPPDAIHRAAFGLSPRSEDRP
ncbi:hypothetical protein ABIA14_004118 [Sinorhizobium fredii]